MSEVYFPFDSVGGDRLYKAEDFRRYFAQIIGNGVIYASSDALKVVADDGMTIKVSSGGAWVDGAGYQNTTDKSITLATADGSLARIDRIVVRVDYSERLVSTEVLQGAYSASPTATDITRDADVYELALADVYVGKGVISISQSNITDQRLNSDVCGIVTGVIEQADTTDIFNQFETYLTEFKAEYVADIEDWTQTQQANLTSWEEIEKAAFLEWLQSIQDILDEDTAGHLQTEIDTLQEAKETMAAQIEDLTTRLNELAEMVSSGNVAVWLTDADDDILLADDGSGLIANFRLATV